MASCETRDDAHQIAAALNGMAELREAVAAEPSPAHQRLSALDMVDFLRIRDTELADIARRIAAELEAENVNP